VKRALLVAMILVPWLTITCGSEPTMAPATMPAVTATAGEPLDSPMATPESTSDVLESPVGLPNPASQYCEDQGYRLEIREEPGGSTGYSRMAPSARSGLSSGVSANQGHLPDQITMAPARSRHQGD
jgi:putative hemolysin